MSKTAGREADRALFTRLEDLPNIGPAVAADLRIVGVESPQDLVGCDPYALYDRLNEVTRTRHDPCMLDTFIAATRFMGGESARPWRRYTAERKRELARRAGAAVSGGKA